QYDLSAGTVTVNNWIAIARGGGTAVMNISGGTLTKNGTTGNHFIVGTGASGILNQTGGLVTNTVGDFYLAENNIGTWNMSGTAHAVVDVLRFSINASGRGTLNLTAGAALTASQFAIGNVAGLSTNNMNGGTIR